MPLFFLLTSITCMLISKAVASVPIWPSYATQPSNFVFRKDQSYIEADIDREAGVDYINSIPR